MSKHFLTKAKAYAALAAAILTAVSDSYASKPLTAVIAVLGVIAVWAVPNAVE